MGMIAKRAVDHLQRNGSIGQKSPIDSEFSSFGRFQFLQRCTTHIPSFLFATVLSGEETVCDVVGHNICRLYTSYFSLTS